MDCEGNMNQITIKANAKNLDFVFSKLDEVLNNYNPPMKFKLQLELVVEELFVNLCSYSYEDEGELVIQYSVEENPLRIIIRFIDNGIPFNPLEKESPDLSLSADKREIGGLGLTIVRKNVDELEYKYENNQNILTVTKIF